MLCELFNSKVSKTLHNRYNNYDKIAEKRKGTD